MRNQLHHTRWESTVASAWFLKATCVQRHAHPAGAVCLSSRFILQLRDKRTIGEDCGAPVTLVLAETKRAAAAAWVFWAGERV